MSEENQRPPLPKQKKKERRRRSSNSESHSWRESDDTPSKPPLEVGVDAASFHKSVLPQNIPPEECDKP